MRGLFFFDNYRASIINLLCSYGFDKASVVVVESTMTDSIRGGHFFLVVIQTQKLENLIGHRDKRLIGRNDTVA